MYPDDSIKKVKEGQYRKFYLDAFVSPTLYGSFSKKSLLDQSLDTLPKNLKLSSAMVLESAMIFPKGSRLE